MQQPCVVAALAAGFLGGIASRYVTPPSVAAQMQTPTPAPQEVRGQSFALTDAQGNTIATFRPVQSFPVGTVGTGTPPVVVLVDGRTGKVIWRAPDPIRIQPLTQR
jgi:hypothetical protein